MCGIVGYKGKGKASTVLLSCLRNLEYRGYDSVGFGIKNNKTIEVKKDVGKINEADKTQHFEEMEGSLGIAHTRWATNGSVTKENSHPHQSWDQNIAVVHNGIIENHSELKKELKERKITCTSQTDSEVIPQFISSFMKEGYTFLQATEQTLEKLKGSYAVVIINKETDELIFARKDSPLVLGRKDEEYFIASDVPAFLEHTNKVIYLDNFEYGYIDDKGEHIFDLKTKKEVKKEIQTIEWTVEHAKKGNHDHFMTKEIYEQEESIKKAVEQDPKKIEEITEILKNAYGIFFVGCGTSYHAAVSSSYIFTHVAHRHVNTVLASEFRNYTDFLTNKTVMVTMSQSGETADLLDAVRIAKEKGVTVISIVNVMGSSLTRLSDHSIMMNAGPEICVCSTKAYTSQLAILLLLAYSMENKIDEAKKLVHNIADAIPTIIKKNNEKIKEIAKKIKDKSSLFLIGRDLAFPSALEGALKIKEVSYIHAEGFAGGELKHGTIALIEKGTPCLALVTKATKELMISNASEIKARGGHIIGINGEDNSVYEDFIEVPEFGNGNPIAMIIPIQLLAYYLAIERDCDPDKPRNLAKSVTVR